MIQVRTAFDLGVETTTIYFSNGTKMPITSAEFGALRRGLSQSGTSFLYDTGREKSSSSKKFERDVAKRTRWYRFLLV